VVPVAGVGVQTERASGGPEASEEWELGAGGPEPVRGLDRSSEDVGKCDGDGGLKVQVKVVLDGGEPLAAM